MKFKQSVVALSIAALLTAAPLYAGQRAPGQSQNQSATTTLPVSSVPLSEEEADTLVFMREEEKLARDVYITLFDLWQYSVFSNVAISEQRHMDMMGSLIEAHGLTDPVVDDSVGAFVNPDLAALYTDLTQQGEASLLDALYVGGLIEETDILDLQDAIAATSQPDLIQAYESLLRASRNHLRAFVNEIELLGYTYEAQLMDQYEVDLILDSSQERGGFGTQSRGRN